LRTEGSTNLEALVNESVPNDQENTVANAASTPIVY